MKSILRIGAVAAASFFFAGCSSTEAVRVHPWERGTLADASMNPGRDALGSALVEHVDFSREAASGGRGVGGSGCGCN
ncbi:MAG TPA: DUF4266 domain-containing protein [Opitutaceae bacterium]|jgi:hypothetical protein